LNNDGKRQIRQQLNFTVTTHIILNNNNYNIYKRFANMKGKIYGNKLPRGVHK
jgi:hypothetical protein